MSSVLKVDTIQNTGGTSALTIDSSGRVLTPAKPSFHAYKSTSGAWQTLGGTGQAVIPLNNTKHNVGGHYDTSNYRFIAPVAGVYLFAAQIYHDANSYFQVRIRLNGSPIVFAQNRDQGITTHATVVYQLAVSDYVDITGAISNSDSDDWYDRFDYSYFCGHLVG